jgi:hypothetical protein
VRVGIMQPYFLPYLGYYQLIENCDVFVLYDNIEYSKRGWINRNRMLFNGAPRTFTLPLAHSSDHLDIADKQIAAEFNPDKLFSLFRQAYRRAPHWESVNGTVVDVLRFPNRNLFDFLKNALELTTSAMGVDTPVISSSGVDIHPRLHGQDRVLATCQALGATEYVNPIGGLELYDGNAFRQQGIELRFLRSGLSPYRQFNNTFVDSLSVVDAMMFLDADELSLRLKDDFSIVEN